MAENEGFCNRSIDKAAQHMLQIAQQQGVSTIWDRYEGQTVCKFGKMGICCRICDIGPCRIGLGAKGPKQGACGADAATIASRHLARQVAAGVAAHSDHGRDICHALLLTAKGKAEGYQIKDAKKLRRIAEEWNIEVDGRPDADITADVAQAGLNMWNQDTQPLYMYTRAPEGTRQRWQQNSIIPRGVDREVVQTLHSTHEGVDSDYRNVLLTAFRTSLADGWVGAMIATDLSDILFGSPAPIRSRANIGVMRKDHVNVLVHGHEPTLSDMVVAASHDPELVALAKEKGAQGIVVAGICCTANEILMRRGAPVVGNFMHQELALATGACDLMLVDVQCMMPSLSDVVMRYHTKLVTTSAKAKMRNATHIQFHEERGYSIAKDIVRLAIENFANRGESDIPPVSEELVAGFTAENVSRHLGGRYRPSYRPLNNGIIDGRIRGVAAVIGCNTPQKVQDKSHWEMVTEFLRNDVLVVQTGCSAHASAKRGLLKPEAAFEHAGRGLQEICRAVGIPPVLHFGSCVDNSRILVALCEMVNEGGIGKELCELPIAGAAPEAMCEKAIAIGFYCVASGAYVNYAPAMRVSGSPEVVKFLTEDIANLTGGRFDFEEDPIQAARNMIDHIDQKRKDLGLGPTMYPVPYEGKQDVSTRRSGSAGSREPELMASGAPQPVCPGGPGSVTSVVD
jgi:carbon-monoxide dehydrogenase catalytic subunit